MIYSKQIKRISTGSKKLDDLLLGGIETHAITEFYGFAGAGKSQVCYTLAVIAAQNKKNGKANTVIYIDTEGKFKPERLVTIPVHLLIRANSVLQLKPCISRKIK